MCRFSWNLGASTSWNPQGPFQASNGIALPLLTQLISREDFAELYSGWSIYSPDNAALSHRLYAMPHNNKSNRLFICFWRDNPQLARASSFLRFLDHTQQRTTVGRNTLDQWSARHRDHYLTTHNRQTSMPPVGFEPTVSAYELPQTYALDRVPVMFPGGKGGLCVRLTILPPSCAKCLEVWEPRPPGTICACPGL